MSEKIITLFGGSGFLGRYVVRELAQAGYRLRIISRQPEQCAGLKTAGNLGQIAIIPGDINRPETFTSLLEGSWAVVNLVGILFEKRHRKFNAIHAQGAERLAKAAVHAGVERFIHVSALGVDKNTRSAYARSKLLGEKAVKAAFPTATILRPSVIFGAEDNFLNQFARLGRFAPALPLIGGGTTRFQPVYVGDVAAALTTCLKHPETKGNIYELGGPEVMSFKEILQFIGQHTHRQRPLMPLSFPLASALAWPMELLPKPPLTRDQVALLKHDNMVDRQALTFSSLNITPQAMEDMAPAYLAQHR